MKSLFIILIATVILSGCAFTPENITLNPKVNLKKQNLGQGKKVEVQVIDERNDSTLGGRISDMGPTAKIAVASNIKKTVIKVVNRALLAYGFQPTKGNNAKSRRLVVRVIALDYRSRAGFWSAGIRINSTIEGAAYNHGLNYDKVYRYTNVHRILFTPTTKSDTKHINIAFSKSLNKLVNDQKLFKFLAR